MPSLAVPLPTMSSNTIVRSRPEEDVSRLQTGSTASSGPGASDDTATRESSGTEGPISNDDLFHLLQNSRRRAVLRCLQGREDPVRMRDVAEQVAAWEHDTTVAELTSRERQRVYIALYQSHLEKLADAGVIEYNKPRGVIEPKPLLDRVASYVDTDWTGNTGVDGDGNTGADEWGRRYLGVSVAGSILLAGTAIDLSVFETISSFAAGVLVLSMFSVLTIAELTLDGDGMERADGEGYGRS